MSTEIRAHLLLFALIMGHDMESSSQHSKTVLVLLIDVYMQVCQCIPKAPGKVFKLLAMLFGAEMHPKSLLGLVITRKVVCRVYV